MEDVDKDKLLVSIDCWGIFDGDVMIAVVVVVVVAVVVIVAVVPYEFNVACRSCGVNADGVFNVWLGMIAASGSIGIWLISLLKRFCIESTKRWFVVIDTHAMSQRFNVRIVYFICITVNVDIRKARRSIAIAMELCVVVLGDSF